LLGDGDKGIEIGYVRKKIFCSGPTRAAKAEQNLVYRLGKPNEPIKEGLLLVVLFESLFASVSTVGRGHSYVLPLLMTLHKVCIWV
jgi:hypothetical protein